MDNTDSTNGDDEPYKHVMPQFPPGTPQNIQDDLNTLATNINEIMETATRIHGRPYANNLALMFTMVQQVSKIESMACQAFNLIIAHEEFPPETRQTAFTKDKTLHLMSSAILDGLQRIAEGYTSQPGNGNFMRDMDILMHRMDVDWNRKGHEG